MSRPTREEVFEALETLLATIGPTGDNTFRTLSRRFEMWTAVSADRQPALYIRSDDDVYVPQRGMPQKVTLGAAIWIYFNNGLNPESIPSKDLSNLLDALDEVMAPPPASDTQTLGGLVSHCWFEGTVFKDPGDGDGQGLVIVPIKILLP